MDLSYILNHLGEDRARHYGAVVPPVYQTSMFCFETVAAMRAALADELKTPFYTRGNNPTVELLRTKLAALEGAEDCLVFGSGSGAIAAGVLALVAAGDHVLCVAKPYSWTRVLVRDWLPRFGIRVDFVDGGAVADYAALVTAQTKLIVLESPNSLTFEQQDLSAIAEMARARGIVTLCDNSYATPLLQTPLALGIDLVAHSGTKYLNGHSDALVGVLAGSAALIRKVFRGPYMTFGAVLGPHEAWLALRGLRTLPLRLARIAQTTRAVADFLRTHEQVETLYEAAAPTVSRFGLNAGELAGSSGLISITLRGGPAAADRFCDALQRFLIACSWGGYESLAFPIAGLSVSENYQATAARYATLVRLSIGLEEPDLLIADLAQALARSANGSDHD